MDEYGEESYDTICRRVVCTHWIVLCNPQPVPRILMPQSYIKYTRKEKFVDRVSSRWIIFQRTRLSAIETLFETHMIVDFNESGGEIAYNRATDHACRDHSKRWCRSERSTKFRSAQLARDGNQTARLCMVASGTVEICWRNVGSLSSVSIGMKSSLLLNLSLWKMRLLRNGRSCARYHVPSPVASRIQTQEYSFLSESAQLVRTPR